MNAPDPATILDWYDRHARRLPWRVPPARSRKGERADPYHIWLSEVMLQQTTVAAVGPYFQEFLERWPRVQELAAAELDEVLTAWAGLGYYARARNLHKCANAVVHDYGGRFPDTEDGLRALPGIGPYTAAAIASIAFDRHAHTRGRQYRAGDVASLCGRNADAGCQTGAARTGSRADPAIAARGLCAGSDGSGGHDLHTPITALQSLSVARCLRGLCDRHDRSSAAPDPRNPCAPCAAPWPIGWCAVTAPSFCAVGRRRGSSAA